MVKVKVKVQTSIVPLRSCTVMIRRRTNVLHQRHHHHQLVVIVKSSPTTTKATWLCYVEVVSATTTRCTVLRIAHFVMVHMKTGIVVAARQLFKLERIARIVEGTTTMIPIV